MAISPDSSEAFLREVDENLRRDQAQQFAKRYGAWIAGAMLLFLAGVGGWLYWQEDRARASSVDGEALSAAMGDIAEGRSDRVALKLDALEKSPSEGIATEARLTRAAVALETGDRASAITLYRSVAEDKDLAQPFRDLATLRLTALDFDTIKPDAVITRLEPLAKPGNPWFGSAGELTAMAMLKQGRKAEAGRLFAVIAADRGVPQSIRSRAVQIAGTLGVDATASIPELSR